MKDNKETKRRYLTEAKVEQLTDALLYIYSILIILFTVFYISKVIIYGR